ncbi:Imm42 family immunity protein [Nocardia sp. alder85J]|uniref:Imm42 family immunity protein n=1 Tax=Nocardia sp. alder85J TaxID=2862949 RepID=UPI001CD456E3|nr:Imm42 family immunity protein [Nocardia sp. alder85J]MCX4091333.1 Imm42 family immunity protein [Nocardia sp. alder85J]
MLVGDRGRFGIEYELDAVEPEAPAGPRRMSGHIRWWCGGESVGHYHLATSIEDVAVAVGRIAARADGRLHADLMDLPAAELVRVVTDALFTDNERTEEQIDADGRLYWPFFVGPRTESFDPWDVFVVEDQAAARLIWCRIGHPEVREFRLRRGEFDDVLRMFLDGLLFHGR